ncbi:unnamed protein product [Aphanomyces euteiches]
MDEPIEVLTNGCEPSNDRSKNIRMANGQFEHGPTHIEGAFPKYNLDLAVLAMNEGEEFNSQDNFESFKRAYFFEAPPAISQLPYPPRVDFTSFNAYAKRLRGMLRDEVDLVRLVSVAYEMLLVMSPFVMNEQQWAEYKDNIHEKDRENAYQLWGPRGVNSRGKVEIHSPMGCVPVWPAKNETALEYVGVWVMKLAKKSPSALDQVFKSYPMMVQDVAAFAKVRANGPRLHFSSVLSLLSFEDRHSATRAIVNLHEPLSGNQHASHNSQSRLKARLASSSSLVDDVGELGRWLETWEGKHRGKSPENIQRRQYARLLERLESKARAVRKQLRSLNDVPRTHSNTPLSAAVLSLNSKVPDATRPIYVFGSHDFRVYKQYHGTLEAWGGPKHESYLNGLSPGHPLYSILQKAIEEAKDFVAVSDAAFY